MIQAVHFQELTVESPKEQFPWYTNASIEPDKGPLNSQPNPVKSANKITTQVESRSQTYQPSALVNTGEVDLRNEFNCRGLIGVLRTSFKTKTVDTVFVIAVRRAQDGSIPVLHFNVIAISKTEGARFSTETFFSFL